MTAMTLQILSGLSGIALGLFVILALYWLDQR